MLTGWHPECQPVNIGHDPALQVVPFVFFITLIPAWP